MSDRPSAAGIVYLVGAGPGDPGLLTVRGHELLERCDTVVYDALANPVLLNIARAANPHVELIDAGKRGRSDESAKQDEINATLVRLAREGKRVVRLKGGDPLVFGRGSEEAQALAREGLAFEIVPGVTAGIAAPAYAGIPVTHRGLSTAVTFVTGHEDPSKPETTTDWAALARAGGTIVLYMGVGTLGSIARALIDGGRSPGTPAASIEWGTHPSQRTVVATLSTLADGIKDAGLGAPVITVIGDVVALREEIAWLERRPLWRRRIVVTRARAQAGAMAARFRELGAEVIEMPAIRIEPLDPAKVDDAIARLSTFDWLIVSSQNAVDLLWDGLRARQLDARALSGMRVAAIGPSTGDALLRRGVVADVIPPRFVAEGLLEALRQRDDVRGRKILYCTAQGSRDALPRGLGELGAEVEVVEAYRSVVDGAGASATAERVERGEIDLVTYTSGSAVDAFVAAAGESVAQRVPAATIGPITTAAAAAHGLTVVGEATESTVEGLVKAVVDWAASRPRP